MKKLNNFKIYAKRLIQWFFEKTTDVITLTKNNNVENNRYVYYLWNYFVWYLAHLMNGALVLYVFAEIRRYYKEEVVEHIKIIILNNFFCINLVTYILIICMLLIPIQKQSFYLTMMYEGKYLTLYVMLRRLLIGIMYGLLILSLIKILECFDNKVDILNLFFCEIRAMYDINTLAEYVSELLENSKILNHIDNTTFKNLIDTTNNYSELKLKFSEMEQGEIKRMNDLLMEQNKPQPPGIFDKYRNRYTATAGIIILILLELAYKSM